MRESGFGVVSKIDPLTPAHLVMGGTLSLWERDGVECGGAARAPRALDVEGAMESCELYFSINSIFVARFDPRSSR